MDLPLILLAAVAAILAAALVWLVARGRAGGGDAGRLDAELRAALSARAAAEATLAARDAALDRAEAAVREAQAAQAAEREARVEADRARALADQRRADAEARMADWEMLRAEQAQAAHAALAETAGKVTAQLLESHRREAEEAKKDGEARVQKATAELQQRFETVVRQLATLDGQVKDGGQKIETVLRALSNPGGAGQFAEIGLENTLKSFGLERDRDFAIQQTVADGEARLRPDAIVFLPGDSALVVDAKASKFALQHAEAVDAEGEQAALQKLAQTMNLHLRALAGRDYKSAVERVYRDARDRPLARVVNVMYLPNEALIEKLHTADRDFLRKAHDARIVPVGPAGLACLVGFCSVEIDLGRQAENRERITEAAGALLESIAVALGHVDKVGKSLQQASKNFGEFAGSVNARLLPRARTIVNLGVRPARNRSLPSGLPVFHVVAPDAAEIIDAEAEADDGASLPAPEEN
ncbi:MAG: DNA recombination protein RmuC [Alphaproteobacteria bacterium]